MAEAKTSIGTNPVKRANWANAKTFNENAFKANFVRRKNANNNAVKLNNISLFLNDVAFYISRCIDNTKKMNARSSAVEDFRRSILSLASTINKDIMQSNPKNSNWLYAAETVNNTLKKYFVKVLNGKIGVKMNRNNKVSYTPIRKVTINRVVQLMADNEQKLTPSGGNGNANVAPKINQNNINKLKNKSYTRLDVIIAMIKRMLKNPNLKPIKSSTQQEGINKNYKKGMESFQKRLTSESEIYNEINRKIQSALLSIAKYEDAIQQNSGGNNGADAGSGVVKNASKNNGAAAGSGVVKNASKNNGAAAGSDVVNGNVNGNGAGVRLNLV